MLLLLLVSLLLLQLMLCYLFTVDHAGVHAKEEIRHHILQKT